MPVPIIITQHYPKTHRQYSFVSARFYCVCAVVGDSFVEFKIYFIVHLPVENSVGAQVCASPIYHVYAASEYRKCFPHLRAFRRRLIRVVPALPGTINYYYCLLYNIITVIVYGYYYEKVHCTLARTK